MRSFLLVIVFALLMIAFFAAYSNFGIPQIEPAPPPVDEEIDLEAMTLDQFAALGERIFVGKGTCTLCHNALGRAPMLDSAAAVAAERLADTRYAGEADDVEGYLLESLVAPSAYVVAGFGKKGTDDRESPMPDVSAGSIRLNEAEITAVIAYLQDLGGAEITVEIPSGAEEPAEEEVAATTVEAEPRAVIDDPRALIAEFACDACHMIDGEGGDLGPDLTGIGGRRERPYLRRAILDPDADIAEGFEAEMMPADMGEQLYAKELEVLVDFLGGLK